MTATHDTQLAPALIPEATPIPEYAVWPGTVDDEYGSELRVNVFNADPGFSLIDCLSLDGAAALGAILDDLDWQIRAACATTDPEAFFPVDGGYTDANDMAKATCCACPVRLDCLQAAIHNDEEFGIWGAMTRSERLRHANGETVDYRPRREINADKKAATARRRRERDRERGAVKRAELHELAARRQETANPAA